MCLRKVVLNYQKPSSRPVRLYEQHPPWFPEWPQDFHARLHLHLLTTMHQYYQSLHLYRSSQVMSLSPHNQLAADFPNLLHPAETLDQPVDAPLTQRVTLGSYPDGRERDLNRWVVLGRLEQTTQGRFQAGIDDPWHTGKLKPFYCRNCDAKY